MGSSTTLIISVKALLISTSVVSIAILFKLSLPILIQFLLFEIPIFWSSILSWLQPPYIYFVINAIIITILASSRYSTKKFEDSDQIQPPIGVKSPSPLVDPPIEFSPVDVYQKFEPPVAPVLIYETIEAPVGVYETIESPVGVYETIESPVGVYETIESPVGVYETIESPIEVYETTEAPIEVYETTEAPIEVYETTEAPIEVYETTEAVEVIKSPISDLKPPVVNISEEAVTWPDENEFVISRSTWTPSRTINSPEKPLVSSRFSHRKPIKASPEGGNRALRVAKPRRQETLESTWKTITDGRHVPLTRHLRKSDTFENHSSHVTAGGSPSASPRHVTKSETFRDVTNYESPSPAAGVLSSSPVSGGRLRKEASPSQDELNRRVEAFIKKFNEEMRLQRQESLNQYVEMVNRGSH